MSLDLVGKWAFLIGLVIAILAGLLQGVYTIPYAVLILVVLGLIVGFLNITTKNSEKFLIANIALMAVGTMTVIAIPSLDIYLAAMLSNFVAFVGAAAFVVSIKAILEAAKK